jgi:hypothetical protein
MRDENTRIWNLINWGLALVMAVSVVGAWANEKPTELSLAVWPILWAVAMCSGGTK